MNKTLNKRRQEIEEIVDNMCLMDDDLMSRVFDENNDATQILIKTILQEEVEVVESKGQWDIKNTLIDGRGIRLVVYAKDSKGDYFDYEVQRKDEGANPRRARFNSSMLDTRMLKKNQSAKDLKDSYVIFITENDYFKKDESVYRIGRSFETGETFEDGSHIIYVNGQYKGNDDLGRLMSDMNNKKIDGFYYKELEEGVKHFKLDEEGRNAMCEAVEKYADKNRIEGKKEGRLEEKIEDIQALMQNLKCTAEQAMETLNVPKSEYNKYLSRL